MLLRSRRMLWAVAESEALYNARKALEPCTGGIPGTPSRHVAVHSPPGYGPQLAHHYGYDSACAAQAPAGDPWKRGACRELRGLEVCDGTQLIGQGIANDILSTWCLHREID